MTNSNAQDLTAAMAAVRAATAAINEALAGVQAATASVIAATASVIAATKALAASNADSNTLPAVRPPVAHRGRASTIRPPASPSGHFCHGKPANSAFKKSVSGMRIVFNEGEAGL